MLMLTQVKTPEDNWQVSPRRHNNKLSKTSVNYWVSLLWPQAALLKNTLLGYFCLGLLLFGAVNTQIKSPLISRPTGTK